MTLPLEGRLLERIEREYVVWLTTVRADGTPQPTPIWFVLDQGVFFFYSRPDTYKLRNIAANPRVSLNFNSTPEGDSVVVITGMAAVDNGAPSIVEMPAFLDKYREGIPAIGMTPESYARTFSVPIRITPTRVRVMNEAPTPDEMVSRIARLGSDIRYVAVARHDQLLIRARDDLAGDSSAQSDRYAEILVNPAILMLLNQRGNIDCGGLDYILIRYGAFSQVVLPIIGGHLSVAIEPHADPLALVPKLRQATLPALDM
jgi:PPOX class probable F420-dependent enzyme